MRKTVRLGLLMLAAWSNHAFSQWSEPVSIAILHTGHSPLNFYVYTTAPSNSCPNNTLWQFRSADTTQDRQKRAYAAILFAFSMGKRVNLLGLGCVDGFQTFDAVQVLSN
jgi:hypothetical protein